MNGGFAATIAAKPAHRSSEHRDSTEPPGAPRSAPMRALSLVLLLWSSASVTFAQAPVDALDQRFERQANDAARLRHVHGGLSMGAGALLLGWAVAGYADGVWSDPSPSAGLLSIGVGLLGGIQGLVWLLIESEAEARLARFRSAPPTTDAERYRYEGEDRAYTGAARLQRALVRWTGLGMVFGGALVIGASAIDDVMPTGWKRSGYVMGAIHAALGAVIMTLSTFPSPGESSSGRRFALAPAGGPGYAGLAFAGRL
tara:strand:+ start:610 stop:1380 length:771 start_codon:yes stop_codon:yes gene_type:complete